MVSVSLVITGDTSGETTRPSVKKHESSNNGNIRLDVRLPHKVDDEQANYMAALLFEQMDQLPSNVIIERVKMSSLRFTPEGVNSFKEFFSMHAVTTTHVSLKNIYKGHYQEDAAIFEELAQAFKESKVEILNLSDNTIPASMWVHWENQKNLRQVLLDQVEMEDQSIIELSDRFSCQDTLEDLYVVLTKPAGEMAVTSISDVLADCQNVTSIRWAYNTPSTEARLPCFGIRQMVMTPTPTLLRHLVLDGSTISVSELGNDGLCGALRKMLHLKTLKLRDMGLRDNGVHSVITALKLSQPPLQWLDLSGNMVEASGCQAITQLVGVEKIISTLLVLALERNQINTDAGTSIIETFSRVASEDFDIRLDENPMNFGKIAFRMARAKTAAEQKIRTLHNDGTCDPSPIDITTLQAECDRHKQEKDILAQAFSIIGVSRQVSESKVLLERIAKLESANRLSATVERTRSPALRASLAHQKSLNSCFNTPDSCRTASTISGDTTPTSSMSSMSSERFRAPNLAGESRSGSAGRACGRRSSISSVKSVPKSPSAMSSEYFSSGASVSTNSFSRLQRAPSVDQDIAVAETSDSLNASFGKFARSSSTRMNTIPDDSDHHQQHDEAGGATTIRSIRLNSYCATQKGADRIPSKHKEQIAKIAASKIKPEMRKMKSRKALTRLSSRQRLLEPPPDETDVSP